MTHLSHLYLYIDNIGLLILILAEVFLTLGLKASHMLQVQYKSHLTELSDMRQSCLQLCRPSTSTSMLSLAQWWIGLWLEGRRLTSGFHGGNE